MNENARLHYARKGFPLELKEAINVSSDHPHGLTIGICYTPPDSKKLIFNFRRNVGGPENRGLWLTANEFKELLSKGLENASDHVINQNFGRRIVGTARECGGYRIQLFKPDQSDQEPSTDGLQLSWQEVDSIIFAF